jgi:hypothetical protein
MSIHFGNVPAQQTTPSSFDEAHANVAVPARGRQLKGQADPQSCTTAPGALLPADCWDHA